MNRKRRFEMMAGLLMAMLAVACSTGETDMLTGETDMMTGVSQPIHNKEPGDSISDPTETYKKTLGVLFQGVWAIGKESAKSDDLVFAEITGYNYSDYFMTFSGFPYQALIDKICPGQTVESIGQPIQDQLPLRHVGNSGSTLFFEMESIQSQPLGQDVLTFDVTLADGRELSVAARFVPAKSNATLDTQGKTFSCLITLDKMTCTEKTGAEQDTKETVLETEMKMKFTSVKYVQ